MKGVKGEDGRPGGEAGARVREPLKVRRGRARPASGRVNLGEGEHRWD